METLTDLIKKKIDWKFVDFIQNCITQYSDKYDVNYSISFLAASSNGMRCFYSTNNYGNEGYLKDPGYSTVWSPIYDEINGSTFRYSITMNTYINSVDGTENKKEDVAKWAIQVIKRIRAKYNICCNNRYNWEDENIFCNGAGQVCCDIALLK